MLIRPAAGILALVLAMAAVPQSAPPGPSVTVPFLLDHNRVFIDLDFVRPDGKPRRARAFVDMGGADLTFAESLAKQLELEHANNLRMSMGGRPLFIDKTKVTAEIYGIESIVSAGTVEVNLPSVILMNYDVVFDYQARTMTLATPGTTRHEGVRIPCRVNPKTGLISMDVGIGSQTYAVTVDNGSAYTWMARGVVSEWTEKHPGWLRGIGAIGDANMNGTEAETTALLARIPSLQIGTLQLPDVGLAGYTERIQPGNEEFFDWYSKKAPEHVIGFLGGNILKSFRLEIDYANRATYWRQQSAVDREDLDQVPLVLRPEGDGSYTVIGICERNGKELMGGILPGDKLVMIGNLTARNSTFGAVERALHGRPGDRRDLVLERRGKRFPVAAKIADLR